MLQRREGVLRPCFVSGGSRSGFGLDIKDRGSKLLFIVIMYGMIESFDC